jgi:hypothetical protein
MENKSEDEIRKRWELEAREKQELENRVIARPRKRLRELEYRGFAGDAGGLAPLREDGAITPCDSNDGFPSLEASERGNTKSQAKVPTRKSGRTTGTRVAAARARGRVLQELTEEDAIELD